MPPTNTSFLRYHNMVWMYAAVFVGAFLFDVIPVPGPPAWMIMLFFYIRYDLNMWVVLVFGVTGSVIGRYIMSQYFRKISQRFITEEKNGDLQFLGSKLDQNLLRSWFFVFIYTLVPLPTTPLFNVMGIGKVKAVSVLPPFLVGKFISDGYMLLAGNVVVKDIPALLHGMLSLKSILVMAGALLSLAALLFIDWMSLIQHKKLRLKFNVFKK
jgi:membrane protein DedA with SNARE-associated domain